MAELAKQPGLVAGLGGLLQFVVKSPDAAFAVDPSGTLTEGRVEGAKLSRRQLGMLAHIPDRDGRSSINFPRDRSPRAVPGD